MNQMVSITASIDSATSVMVTQAAEQRGISPAEYVAEVVQRAAESDADYRAFIQAGIDSADRGELVSQDEVERWFEERIAARRRT